MFARSSEMHRLVLEEKYRVIPAGTAGIWTFGTTAPSLSIARRARNDVKMEIEQPKFPPACRDEA